MNESAATNSILARVAKSDASAVDECIKNYGPLVMAIAMKMLGHRGDAEDATQEIFVDIWKSAERYDPKQCSESTFVAMIARRRLIDRKRRRPQFSTVSVIQDVAAINPDQLETNDEARKIRLIVDTLAPEQRTALMLAIEQDCTHAEIATRLALPLGSVKTLIRRGLQLVRDAIKQGGRS